jgi:signal transduction histidine kinase
VTVTLRLEGRVELAVADDGAGFDIADPSAGIGLSSMRERAENLGGTLTVRSSPGQGTTIQVTIG